MGVGSERGGYRTLARAKVNLTLEILGRRPDGYHELRSLVAFADCGDQVTLTPGEPDGVEMRGPFAHALAGANIAETALSMARAAFPALAGGLIRIEKNLPMAAGLGGGSADAAAVLRLLQSANPGLAHEDWHFLARRLGADVPICVVSRTSFMRGIGERIDRIVGLPTLPAVLAWPIGVAPPDKTKAVFNLLGAGPLGQRAEEPLPELPSDRRSLIAALARSRNDLEAPARHLMPEVAKVFDRLKAEQDAAVVRLSGAGPTVYALFEREDAASAVARRVAAKHPEWWVQEVLIGDATGTSSA